MADDDGTRIVGAVHVAGAATVAAAAPPQRLLWTDDERFTVTVACSGAGEPAQTAVVTITNASGAALGLARGAGDGAISRLECGDTVRTLALDEGFAVLALQATPERGAGADAGDGVSLAPGAGADAGDGVSLVLSAEVVPTGISFVGQLFVRRITAER